MLTSIAFVCVLLQLLAVTESFQSCRPLRARYSLLLHARGSEEASVLSKIEYRNAQIKDMEDIAVLCSNTFEPEFPWYQPNKRKESIARFLSQFLERKVNYVDKGLKHTMLVATETTADKKKGE